MKTNTSSPQQTSLAEAAAQYKARLASAYKALAEAKASLARIGNGQTT